MGLESSRVGAPDHTQENEKEPFISPQRRIQLENTYGEAASVVEDLAEAALVEDARPEVANLDAMRRDAARTSGIFEGVRKDAEDFEKQFKKEHSFTFEKDTLTYQMIEPSPERLVHKEWVVFVGGFNTVAQNYKYEIANLVQSGRRVLFVNPETPLSQIKKDRYKEPSSVDPLIRFEAEALGVLLTERGIVRADLVGHSRGGLVAAVLASERPELADSLVLDCPAGFSGAKETPKALIDRALEPISALVRPIAEPMELAGRAFKQADANKKNHPNESEESGAAFLRQIATHLWWKVLVEMPATARSFTPPILEKIQQNKKAGRGDTHISLINAHGDELFTPELVEKALMPNPGDDPFNYVDEWISYADKKAGHGKISRPHEGIYPEILSEGDEGKRVIATVLERKNRKAA